MQDRFPVDYLAQAARRLSPSAIRSSEVANEKRTQESAPKASPGTAATCASEQALKPTARGQVFIIH